MNTQKMLSTSTYTSKACCNANDGVYQHVTVGTVAEVCPEEFRVAMTPSLAHELILNGHTVYFQTGAGKKAGFTDEMYKQAGATMLSTTEEVYKKSSIIVKVQQPQTQEFSFIQPNQVIFCFIDYTNQTSFLKASMERSAVVVGYQSIQSSANTFPVFNAVSEITGYIGVQEVMKTMEKQGCLFGEVAGVYGSHVLILGAGACGLRSALFAVGTGARVTVMDTCTESLRKISEYLPASISTVQYTTESLERMLPTVDVLIGAVRPVMYKAPVLVTEKQMTLMRPGTFAIDLAIDMGGNFAISTLKTLQAPTFTWNGITIYSAGFITSLFPHISSTTLSNSVLPWVLQVANKGWQRAVLECYGLQQGLCVAEKQMTSYFLSNTTEFSLTPVEQVLEKEIQHFSFSQQNTNLMSLKQQLSSFRTQQLGQSTGFTIEA